MTPTRRLALLLFGLALAICALQIPAHHARATEQFANTAASTLGADITSGATSLTVASATRFPTTGTFRIKIDSELIIVGAVSGTTFSSLTRGAESTTAAAHTSGTPVYGILTAGALSGFQSDTLSSAALSASGLYVPLAGNPAVLKSLALDPSSTAAYASQGVFRSYFSQGWYSRNSANTGDTEVIGTNGANSILIGSGSGTGASASVFINPTTSIQLQTAGTSRVFVESAGLALVQSSGGSYGGGVQVVFMGNRVTAPSSNPTGGGILYAESGDLYYRASGGGVQSVSGVRTTRAFPSDADYTAVQADYQATILEMTGAITATRAVIMPATSGLTWPVYNNTSGGFTVTFKGSGRTGISVPNGQRVNVYANGTDVVGTQQAVGASYGTYANRPSAIPVAGVLYFASDGHTPWVSTGSAWAPQLGGTILGTQPAAASTFSTTVNVSTAAIADSNGAIEVTGLNDGNAGSPTFRGWVAGAAANGISICLDHQPASISTATANIFDDIGIFLRESSTSKIVTLSLSIDHAASKTNVVYGVWTASTTRSSSTTYAIPNDGNPVVLGLRKSGSNIITEYTRFAANNTAGAGWTTIRTDAVTSTFTTAANQEGFFAQGYGTIPHGFITHLNPQ